MEETLLHKPCQQKDRDESVSERLAGEGGKDFIIMQTKTCTNCKTEKLLTDFFKCQNGKYGVESRCKKCERERVKKWEEENQDRVKEWRLKNRKKIAEYKKDYYQKNKASINAKSRRWARENKKRKAEADRLYREKNKERLALSSKEYNSNPKNRRKANDNRNFKRHTKTGVMLNHKMGCNMRKSLKSNKGGKHWEKLVNYSLADLKFHIESLFKEGMTWENYGEWHIDHIIPLNIFDISSPKSKGFKKAWALNNLRPMWASDNIRKSDKLFMAPMVA